MSYLVDTNIFSEPAKPKPDAEVVAWLREHEAELYVSSITIGEIRRGIERLPDGKRKTQLRAAFQRAHVPDVPELQELFLTAQPKVLALTSAPP